MPILQEGSVDALIESAARRGNIPDAQMTYILVDFLAIAEEELNAYALPVLHARREDYYLEEIMFDFSKPDTWIAALVPSTMKHPAWRLPRWALASAIRDVQAISSGGASYNLGRIELDDVPNMIVQGWYFYGDYIVYQSNTFNSSAPPVALRCIVHVKPNRLVVIDKNKCISLGYPNLTYPQQITAVNGKQITVANADGFGATKLDIISGTPGYEVKIRDSGFIGAGPTYTLTDAGPTNPAVGDWAVGAGYTPMVPLPTELHPLLAQRMVVKFLEAQGETDQLEKARAALTEMALQIPILIQPRAEGKPKKLAPRMGLWRRWRW